MNNLGPSIVPPGFRHGGKVVALTVAVAMLAVSALTALLVSPSRQDLVRVLSQSRTPLVLVNGQVTPISQWDQLAVPGGVTSGPIVADSSEQNPTGTNTTLTLTARNANNNIALNVPVGAVRVTQSITTGDAFVNNQLQVQGLLVFSGAAPAVSACGAGATITGANNAIFVTVGTLATGCVITFNTSLNTFPQVPACAPTNREGKLFTYTTSTTTLTITGVTDISSSHFDIPCSGRST